MPDQMSRTVNYMFVMLNCHYAACQTRYVTTM